MCRDEPQRALRAEYMSDSKHLNLQYERRGGLYFDRHCPYMYLNVARYKVQHTRPYSLFFLKRSRLKNAKSKSKH